MAQIIYPCFAEMHVKPSIVIMTLKIFTSGKDAKSVLSELNDKLSLARDFCIAKPSYRENSYSQENISFRENHTTEYFYRHLYLKDTLKTEVEYKNLTANEQQMYARQSRKIFDNYTASTRINITLNNTETVIDDFTSIVNMSTDQSLFCSYEHTILPEQKKKYMRQLYINCVNQGMNDIIEIANGIPYFNPEHIEIVKITEDIKRERDYGIDFSCKSAMLAEEEYTPENYFIPELVQELFNNNIVLSKKLDIVVGL